MAGITLTTYECDRDLLPPVCAKCGDRAEDRVTRAARYLPSDASVWTQAGVVGGLLLFPPLFLWIIYQFAQVIRVRVPMCETHRSDWVWRDRASDYGLVPAWTLAVLASYALGGVVAWGGGNGVVFFLTGPLLSGLGIGLDLWAINFRAVMVAKAQPGDGVKLTRVSAGFVAAVLADRARSRVWDPDRRPKEGDVRDDYDDEPV